MQAIGHILIPLIAISLIRDYKLKKKHRQLFPLHYVIIAGIAGLIPDIDIAIFWFAHYIGFGFSEVHRTFTHTFFTPILFLLLTLLFSFIFVKPITKSKLHLNLIMLMCAFGSLMHIFLDFIFAGYISPYYPFITDSYGLNLIGLLPAHFQSTALPALEGIIFVSWLIYLEWKHKISDFI